MVWFHDGGPLHTETCRNVECGVIIQISKEQYYAFCWFSVVNPKSEQYKDYIKILLIYK